MTEQEDIKEIVKSLRKDLDALQKLDQENKPRFHEHLEQLGESDRLSLAAERENYLGELASKQLELAAERSVSQGLVKNYPIAERIMKIQNQEVIDAHGGIEEAIKAQKRDLSWLKSLVPIVAILVGGFLAYYFLSNPDLQRRIFTAQNEDLIVFVILGIVAIFFYFRQQSKKGEKMTLT